VIKAKTVTADELMAAVMRYGTSGDVVKGYACAPLRWLKEQRWELDYQPPPTTSPPAASHGLAEAAADMLGNTERGSRARALARMEFDP